MTNVSSPEESPKKMANRSLLFKVFVWMSILCMVGMIVAGVAAYRVYHHIIDSTAVSTPETVTEAVPVSPVRVTIPEGATGKQVGDILADNGLIEHEFMFRIAIKLDDSKKPILHGRYDLPPGASARDLLHILQEGPNAPLDASEMPDELKVVVPEGLSLVQAAALFDSPQAFIEAASDPTLIARMGIEAKTLEGFLMPNTYFFVQKPTEREVVERMLEQFEIDYAALAGNANLPINTCPSWSSDLQNTTLLSGTNKLDIVTIASLIEEEAKVSDERPHVAAVIYNRLKKKMPLQLDSTLQYALNKYGQRLLYEDREVDSPYNTYKHAGLPPGPISSPGVDALRAALHPSDEPYLYFVSNADGKTHTFSATEKEHLKAVARYRKEIASQRKAQQR